jgi:hypothetical protein
MLSEAVSFSESARSRPSRADRPTRPAALTVAHDVHEEFRALVRLRRQQFHVAEMGGSNIGSDVVAFFHGTAARRRPPSNSLGAAHHPPPVS